MDAILGLVGDGYALLLADCTAARNIVAFKHDESKFAQLDDCKVLACAGENASRVEFSEYIAKNMALQRIQTGLEMSNHAAAHFIRSVLARSLRTRNAYQTNVLLAGVDVDGPALYYLDYFGSLQKVNFMAHGYSAYFVLSLMDCHWREGMPLEEGKQVLRMCLKQLKERFFINLPKFQLKVITKDGVADEEL